MIFHTRPILEAILPINLKSQNTGRGNAWYGTAEARRAMQEALYPEYNRNDPFDYPVGVLYTRVCGVGQRSWDNDNLAISCKQLQDALTALGWWHDDSDKWLRCLAYRHDTSRRQQGPAVMVSVFRLEDE
ncbi:MAG: hypothetical protein HKN35_15885 [Woeseia sp.]|nr:hypothetical protein [Woeseia sp.]